MAFHVKPFKEIIALSEDEALAPVRARAAKAKADLEVAKADEKLMSLEAEIHKLCAEKELNFDKITDKMDEYDLVDRRRVQITKLVADLFPENT